MKQMSNLEVVGPLSVRRFTLAKVCDSHQGHSHHYDHATVVIAGRLIAVYRDRLPDGTYFESESREYTAGDVFYVAAERHHTLKALEPNTRYHCMFSHRDFDGIVSQAYLGNLDEAAHVAVV